MEIRVSKYNPSLRNSKGEFLGDEWTSFTDIGKIDGPTIEQYLDIEQKYWMVVEIIVTSLGIKNGFIDKIEFYHDKFDNFSGEEWYNLYYDSLSDYKKLGLCDGEVFNVSLLRELFVALIREVAWFQIHLDKETIIELRHDMYLYIRSNNIFELPHVEGVYIEEIVV